MANWMEHLRAQQADLAAALATRLLPEIVRHVPHELRALDGMFDWRGLVDSHTDVDVEVVQSFLEQEVHDDVLEAVHGYSDWAAARLVRSGDFRRQALPVPDHADRERIAATYGVTIPLLTRVVGMLKEMQRIPLMGVIEGGELLPDKETLLRWKELYDWSRA